MIKTILKSVREYKVYAILTPIFMLCEVALECSLPFVMSLMVDKLSGTSQILDGLWVYIVGLVAMAMGALLFGVLSGTCGAKASTGLAKNLRYDLYSKIQGFSFENIDKFSQSSLITRLTSDVTNVQNSFQMCIRIAIRCPAMFIFAIVMSFIMGGNMAWIFVCIIPVIGIGLIVLIKLALPVFNRVFKKIDKLNESVQENVKGIRVVKSYVREDYEEVKLNKASDAIKTELVKVEKILSYNNPLMQFGVYIATILVSCIGAYLIITTFGGYDAVGDPVWGVLSPGQMSSLIIYGNQILMSLMMLSMVFVMITMSVASFKRITEVLKEEPAIKNPKDPIFNIKNGSVEFQNVSFKYSRTAEKNALSDVNLKFESGQTIGILGPTGSSKTTLINLVSRLYDATEGNVLVGGINVKDYDLDSLRDAVAVVLQKNVLFSGTIKENLKWGNINATDEEIQKACEIAQADEFIQTFKDKYDTYIEQGGTNVSGGQKQRLCIARAILKKPKVLILDDSTSAVDTKTDSLIRKGLINDIPDTTKIIIAQRTSSIEDADQIIVMNDGFIEDVGTHSELLMRNEIYKEVYNTQNGGKNNG